MKHVAGDAGRNVGLGGVSQHVAGVLLAAGEGTRLGGPKALVEVAGIRLVDRGVALLRDGGTAPVVVVTGAVDVAPLGVITVHNPDWRSGMGSSLAAGLGALPRTCAAAVIALVDQPLVGPGAVRRLVAAYQDGATIAVASYDGKLRNPVLLARDEWAGVLALATGDVGARPYLHAHPDRVTAVECGDIGRPDDVDTPEDLARASRLLAPAGSAPAPGGPPAGTGQPAAPG
jgi:CTP:molybdopterin cytidylyltransferase MocA